MAAMFTDDPDELNNRYMPEEDEEDDIPEEELTEEDRKTIKMFEGWTEETWQILYDLFMDEEDCTLSNEEFGAKNIIGSLNSTNPVMDNDIKLGLAKSINPKDAVYVIERLKKKPEEGVNIPSDILDMIYAKAK